MKTEITYIKMDILKYKYINTQSNISNNNYNNGNNKQDWELRVQGSRCF